MAKTATTQNRLMAYGMLLCESVVWAGASLQALAATTTCIKMFVYVWKL